MRCRVSVMFRIERLQLLNLAQPFFSNAFQLRSNSAFPVLAVPNAWEPGIASIRNTIIGEHQLPNYIVQRCPEVIEHVPKDHRKRFEVRIIAVLLPSTDEP